MEASEPFNLWETDFKASSPNAAIIGDNAKAVLELVNASLNNGQINFTFSKIIDGNLGVGSIGDVSIFIDDSSYTLHVGIGDSAIKKIDQKDQTLVIDEITSTLARGQSQPVAAACLKSKNETFLY